MRILLSSLLILILAAVQTVAQDSIPPKLIAEVKASTVSVHAKNSAVTGSGSGFVIKIDDGSVYIATNQHVINLPAIQRKGAKAEATVSVVFASGTADEETKTAEVIDSDPSRDLAILKVAAPKAKAEPIAMLPTKELIETMPVFIFGFPFGSAMAVGKKGPSITVGRGSVSSIRRDDFDRVVAVQIDGALNPGNSGGPVVDARGRLVGIAVAKIDGANIGLAIPAEGLTQMLDGRVGALAVRPVASPRSGMLGIEVDAQLIDPIGRMKSVSVHHASSDERAARPSPNADGTWPPIAGATKVDLKVNGHRATGSFEVASADGVKATFKLQISYVNGLGKLCYTAPTTEKVALEKTPSVADRKPSATAKDLATDPKLALDTKSKKKDQAAKGKESKGGFKTEEIAPRRTNTELGSEVRTVGDLRVTDLKLGVEQVPRAIRWSADGKSFYFLEQAGILRRVQIGDFVELMQVDLGKTCSWLSQSAEGLIVTLGDTKEIWVVDPITFVVKSKIAVDSLTRAVSSPALSIALAAGDQRGPSHPLAVVDLKSGKVVREYTSKDFDGNMVGFINPDVTPDGKYLFSQGGVEQLQRYKIKGDEVTFDQASERLASNGQAVEISPGGEYVALPAGGGNGGGAYTTNVFKATDLAKPEIVIRAGAFPKAIGFDTNSGFILAQNQEFPLILFKPSGAKVKDYKLTRKRNLRETTRQFVVHPDGGKFLVLTDASLYYVELAEK